MLSSLVDKSSYLRVLLNGRDSDNFHHGSIVKIGIPADVIAKGAMVVYMLPLIGLFVGALLGFQLFGSDFLSMVLGGVGFLLGAGVVYRHHLVIKNDPRYQPVLVDDFEKDCVKIISS